MYYTCKVNNSNRTIIMIVHCVFLEHGDATKFKEAIEKHQEESLIGGGDKTSDTLAG